MTQDNPQGMPSLGRGLGAGAARDGAARVPRGVTLEVRPATPSTTNGADTMTGAEILAAIAAGKGIITAAVSIGRTLFTEGKLTKAELDEIEARGAASDAASDAHAAAVAARNAGG